MKRLMTDPVRFANASESNPGSSCSALAFLILATVLCCGCTHVRSEITSFHTLAAVGNGETFVVLPSDTNNVSSLEFAAYSKMISDKLESFNYRLCACDASNADLVVLVLYGIDTGRTALRSAPVYGQIGGGYTSYSGMVGSDLFSGTAYSQPQFGVVGSRQYSETEFMRFLLVSIADNAELRKGKVTWRYEGKAISTGSSGNLARIVPVMIEALFNDFPGKSGKTRRVDLPFQ